MVITYLKFDILVIKSSRVKSCLLLVSRLYLALDITYGTIRAAFSNDLTR